MKNEEGTVNMCEALKKLERECEARGSKRGRLMEKYLDWKQGLENRLSSS